MHKQRRAIGAALAAIIGFVPLTVFVTSPASAAVGDLVINEVNSDPSDWFELANTTGADIDLTGLWYVDGDTADPGHWVALSGTIAAGGLRAVDSAVGLGKGDSVSIYQGDKAAFDAGAAVLVDTVTWPAGTHATSWGRCTDVTGAFRATAPTRGAVNACTVTPPAALDPNWDDIEINEVASLNDDDAGNPGFGDAIELVNTGSHPVSIEGWYQTDSGAATGASPLTLADLKAWDGDSLEPAASWIVPDGGYVAISS